MRWGLPTTRPVREPTACWPAAASTPSLSRRQGLCHGLCCSLLQRSQLFRSPGPRPAPCGGRGGVAGIRQQQHDLHAAARREHPGISRAAMAKTTAGTEVSVAEASLTSAPLWAASPTVVASPGANTRPSLSAARSRRAPSRTGSLSRMAAVSSQRARSSGSSRTPGAPEESPTRKRTVVVPRGRCCHRGSARSGNMPSSITHGVAAGEVLRRTIPRAELAARGCCVEGSSNCGREHDCR